MHNGLNQQSEPFPALAHVGKGYAPPSGGVSDRAAGGQRYPEGGPVSGEAAGLVQYKTSPNLVQVISFDKFTTRLKRLKRLKCSTYLAGQLHSIQRPGYRPCVPWLVTLTYDTLGTRGRGCHDWQKDHISRATDRYRRWCKSMGYPSKYTWVGELTAAGTVHYHMVLWLPPGVRMPFWDKKQNDKLSMWPHGMSKVEKLKTNCSYLMKYLSKMGELHDFPHGMRLSGNGGLDQSARNIRSWHNLPVWVKIGYGVGEVSRKKCGLVVMETGELLPPMYRRKFIPGGMELHQLREMPEKWQTSGGELYFGPYSSVTFG